MPFSAVWGDNFLHLEALSTTVNWRARGQWRKKEAVPWPEWSLVRESLIWQFSPGFSLVFNLYHSTYPPKFHTKFSLVVSLLVANPVNICGHLSCPMTYQRCSTLIAKSFSLKLNSLCLSAARKMSSGFSPISTQFCTETLTIAPAWGLCSSYS